ncbi:hypothetical protein HanPI659440_Chr13g0506991 [Helianthus annuus]|nr:hypothetical protein HanPI659440_Chr13g0506991 [Helianthus annuus]
MDSHENDGNGVACEAIPPSPSVPEDVVPEQATEPINKCIKQVAFFYEDGRLVDGKV